MNHQQSRVLDGHIFKLFVVRVVVELESGEQCEDLLLHVVYVVQSHACTHTHTDNQEAHTLHPTADDASPEVG